MNARPMSPATLLLEGALYATSPAQKANFERAHAELTALLDAADEIKLAWCGGLPFIYGIDRLREASSKMRP